MTDEGREQIWPLRHDKSVLTVSACVHVGFNFSNENLPDIKKRPHVEPLVLLFSGLG